MRTLKLIRRGRPKIEPGLVFALRTSGGHYFFGRVVRPVLMADSKCALVYIYDHIAKSIDDVPNDFPLSALLLPPCIVAQRMWTLGYFVKVGCKPFTPSELKKHHVFEWGARKVNEHGDVVKNGPRPTERYSLILQPGIQAMIEEALRRPRI